MFTTAFSTERMYQVLQALAISLPAGPIIMNEWEPCNFGMWQHQSKWDMLVHCTILDSYDNHKYNVSITNQISEPIFVYTEYIQPIIRQ